MLLISAGGQVPPIASVGNKLALKVSPKPRNKKHNF